MTNYKVSVPKPCHENWNAMTPDTQGRFCSLCEKTVVDFTGMPAPQISSYLIANAGKKVCGRFNSEQVEAKPFIPLIPRSVLFSQTSFRKMFLLALFVTMGTTLFSCRNETMGEPAIVDDTEQHVDSPPQNKDQKVISKVADTDSLSQKVKTIPAIPKKDDPSKWMMGEVAPPPPEPTHLMGDTIVVPQ